MGAVIDGYISTFSGSFSIAVLVWPLLSLLLSLPILLYLYRRDGWLPLTATLAVYMSILYAAGLVCFTLYPLPSGDSGPGITYGIPPVLNPLNFISDIAQGGLRATLQLLLNIVLFVPLGFIAKTLLKLKLPSALALSLVVTCTIETAQLTGLFGMYPYAFRTFDVDDIICNTLGGLGGWALGQLATKLILQGSTQMPPITHEPGFARRAVALWTDAAIIDICAVIPRLVIMIGLTLVLGDIIDSALLEHVNAIVFATCFIIAFALVEIIIPWKHHGSTPAGMFYRMSCKTQQRTGAMRVAFYALRALVLFLLLVFLRYSVVPFALFYLVTRKMPYDFIPSSAHRPISTIESIGDQEATA